MSNKWPGSQYTYSISYLVIAGGGGGGGQAYGGAGGSGGSGIAVISIPTINYTGIVTGSPTVTTSGTSTILRFAASGTYLA